MNEFDCARFDRACELNEKAGAFILLGAYRSAATLLEEAAGYSPSTWGRQALLERAAEAETLALQDEALAAAAWKRRS